MACLDDNLVLAYVEGAGSEAERTAVKEHLAQCAPCRALVEAVRQVMSRSVVHSTAREALAVTPPVSDPVARALVRTRVASRLFDHAAGPVTIGRFHVLERIGRGGMGRVYAAYDPDLDRRIAVKLVPAGDRKTRDRMLGEAQALARLSHPHVVPVHDVQVVDDQVCIVMEFVRGQTLRAWRAAARRSWRDVLHVYRQLGEGLEAAHRAGLVHRDVKPDNAIVGDDGRVRVVDFGLARSMAAAANDGDAPPTTAEPHAPATRPAGTPRYMAPEQAAGKAVTAAADQYAFCAALREALDGAAPWLEPVLDRGTASDPAERFASMSELLRALARDPAAIRRRRLLGAAIAIVLAGGGAIAGVAISGREPRTADEPCSGGPGEIAPVWNAARRAELAAHLDATGPYGAAMAPRLLGALDEYATRWAANHRAACLAHLRGEQTSTMLDGRMACLGRIKGSMSAVVDVLGRSDGGALSGAAVAVAALPALEACDGAPLSGPAAPDAAIAGEVARLDGELDRADVLIDAGRADEARDLAGPAVEAARRIAYPPVLARSLLTVGKANIALSPRTRAIAPLREATAIALRAGNDALAVEAYARRAWVEATDDGPEEENILDGLAVIEALADRIPHGGFVRALLYNNVAAVESAAGRRDRRDVAMQRALLAARDVSEPVPVELIRIRGNLANYVTDPRRRTELFDTTVAELSSRLGAEHPWTLDWRFRFALTIEDPTAAGSALTPICTTYQRLHSAYGVAIASCWFELGWLAYDQRDVATAVRAWTAATDTPAAEPEKALMSRGFLALVQGDRAGAMRAFDGALALVPADGPWWSRVLAGSAHLGRGLVRREAGDRHGAAADFATAETLLAPVAVEYPYAHITRRLARVRAERARP